nr:hypothetical protein [Tanacetum cinerariifolium]
MRRVGKGFSRVDTLLFDRMLVPQQVPDDVADDVADVDAEPTPPSPTPVTTPPHQQELIPSPLQVTSTPPPSPHQSPIAQPSSPPPQQPHSHDATISMDLLNQLLETCATLTKKEVGKEEKRGCIQIEGKIAELDADEDVILEEVDAEKDVKVQGRLPEGKLMLKRMLITTATTITATPAPKTSAPRRRRGVIIQDPKEAATASLNVQSDVMSKDKGKGILVEEPKPLKRQAQIEQDEAFARELEAQLNANINWNKVIEKNMMVYLKNMAGFKIDFFKGMSYTDIRPIFEKHFNFNWAFLEKGEKEIEEEESKLSNRKSETFEHQAAKKQKINEEVQELKTHLQIIPNNEDDVYTKATPLALKVPVVDYQIHTEHNKPYYKIIRADGSHQFFLSFISMLRNFDKEDLEMLWKIV